MSTILKGDFVYRDSHPIVVQDAVGVRLISAHREYIDCQASSGAAVLGYDRALLDDLDFSGGPLSKPQTCESPRRLRFADRLEGLVFDCVGRRGRIGFELGGAQGIELALKVALCAHSRISLLTIEGAYHGRSLFTSHLSSSRRYTLGTDLAMSHFRLPNPYFVAERERISLERATDFCIRYTEQAFNDERYSIVDPHGSTPVFLFEPVQNVSGMLDLPADYLIQIEKLVKERAGVVVADEIFSGMYRFGPLFAHAEKSVAPDVIVFSKGLTNGIVPLSAIWVSDDSGLAGHFVPGTHSCTYLNGELGFVIANRVLDALSTIDTQAISRIGADFLSSITLYCNSHFLTQSFSKGSVLRIDLPDRDAAQSLSDRLLNNGPVGVLHAKTGLAHRSIIFHPPYTISLAELDCAARIVGNAIGEIH
ncbi:MAG: aminotransferase class III-fold pyridoxal phosphate-dependent enzyme [Nitratireductor sp.]